VRIERITTREGLQRLEGVWNRLLERSACNTIALTFEWLTTWWDVFGQDRELFILVVRKENEVIAIAPLLERTIRHYRVLPYRRLEFLASGENEADEICSEYLDFIVLAGHEEAALQCIFDYLREHRRDWDELVLTDTPASSANLPIIKRLTNAAGMITTSSSRGSAIVRALPESWDGFLTSLSRDFRKKILRDLKTFRAESGELLEIDTDERFQENFRLLVDLHQSRWNAQGEPGVFSSNRFREFHSRLAPKLLKKGWLKLFVMKTGGEPVAALYDFVYGRKIYYYQSGFRLGWSKMSSPGILIRTLSIRRAIEEGLTECDFLKGPAGSYKYRWGGTSREIIQLRIAPAGSKEAAYRFANAARTGLRQVKRAFERAASI
jgi:CelD/BcsL family acetyltransferase involved in cellulose biosynthesis